ncbi:MAG: Ig-like domain-containing protein [Bacteroidales bacterium]|nr:Ig-like domain-containing protein [Bacteroidales bacterium]MBR5908222.1 Ig-like domain-containing protein [Bacteroidales bacterium]
MKKITNILRAVAVLCAAGLYISYSQSCANTSKGPQGGPKDTIPPVIVSTLPDSVRCNFPTQKGKIYLNFNEYVQLKNQATEIVVSPPMIKRPTAKIKKKSVVLTFNDTLKKDQTYSIYFGESISDVNEGNPFSNYVYTFSTGSVKDSLLISGTVMDYQTLLPKKGVLVTLYKNPKDSSVVLDLPDAISKTDEWGYFCVRALKGVPYTVYAVEDKNNNYLYDKGVEFGGFCDSLITPTIAEKKGLPQIAMMDMKDTVACLSRPSQTDIYIFKERPDRQYLTNSGRVSERECFLKFNAANPQIDTFLIKGVYSDKIIRQFNAEGDSLSFWINERRSVPDTLFMRLCYQKTDSTGKLVPESRSIKLVKPFDKSKIKNNNKKGDETNTGLTDQSIQNLTGTNKNTRNNPFKNQDKEKDEGKQPKEREDLLKFNLTLDAKNVENMGIEITFPTPLIKANFDSLFFTTSTPRKVVSNFKFHAERDSSNILRYVIYADDPYKVGNDYLVRIPAGIFQDVNGFTNDSLRRNFSLPNDDNLSSITLQINNTNGGRYIVELVNEKRDKTFLKYIVTKDGEYKFPYLNAGNYSFRITEDKNGNGKLDVGNVLKRIPPEKARLFRLPDGKALITLRQQMDLTQTVDLKKLFE